MQARAVGYIRVSTAGQATDGVSLEAQRTRIKAWCEANDYHLVGIHQDVLTSRKRLEHRSGLVKAMNAVCSRRKGALVVYSLSRMARSTKEAITLAERLDKAGADLVSLSEKIDTTTAAGKMLFRMLAVLAEFERDLVSERTTAALAVKRASGQRIGTVPYGFDLDDDGVALVENGTEQTIIADIGAMRRAGKTLKQIASTLTERKVPTKTGKSAKWTHQAVSRILSR